MNYLDGFSGYGGFRYAFEQAGWKFNKVWFSEIDKYAIANYKYNFPNSEYAGSITDISGLPKLDLFTFGWPCQDNSIAGKRKGQKDGTRSGLLFSAISCIERFQPRNFVAENVKGLQSVNGGIDIIESLRVLSYLNDSCPQYDIEMQLLNTRWFLPQNRERLFFVGHLRGPGSRKIFPIGEVDSRINERPTNSTVVRCITAGGNSGGHHSGMTLIYNRPHGFFKGSINNFAPTFNSQSSKDNLYVVAMRGREDGQQHIEKSKGDYTNTLTSVQKDNLVIQKDYTKGNSQGNRVYDVSGSSVCLSSAGGGQGAKTGLYEVSDKIRRLTPIECERLQGLPDNWTKNGIFEKQVWINKKEKTFKIIEGVEEISDSQRYKMIGNGVSIPPVKLIAERLRL
jgi:DNA (cytosine-5)-methyltransferase 1